MENLLQLAANTVPVNICRQHVRSLYSSERFSKEEGSVNTQGCSSVKVPFFAVLKAIRDAGGQWAKELK